MRDVAVAQAVKNGVVPLYDIELGCGLRPR